jgi:hypothetical protein
VQRRVHDCDVRWPGSGLGSLRPPRQARRLWLWLTGASPFQRNAEMVGDCLQAILSPDNAAHRENR